MRRHFLFTISMVMIVAVSGCTGFRDGPPPRGSEADIAELAQKLRGLDEGVDPDEAGRAARVAYEYTHELAVAYEITDPPLIHNIKVNGGTRPRGLCWHWAEDMEQRLQQENFKTLDLHRAIANSDSSIIIDHSTALISADGAPIEDAIVLDPWRKGGVLFWSPMQADPKYEWKPRLDALRDTGRLIYASPASLGTQTAQPVPAGTF